MATDPIILDRQILGLIKQTFQRHHKRQEDKSIIVSTYNAQNPCTNGKRSEKARSMSVWHAAEAGWTGRGHQIQSRDGDPEALYTVGKESHT